MNPFDLRGPEFLLFYAALAALALIVLILARRWSEDGSPPGVDLSDPYLLAYLRAGENEALRVGVLSLLDRGLLVANDTKLRWNRPDADRYVRRPIERELLNWFKTESEAADVFTSTICKQTCEEYAQGLARSGALPDDDRRRARRIRLVIIAGILVIVGIIKILIGLSRNAPVSFLVGLTVVAAFAAYYTHNPFRTRRGDRLLSDIRLLFSGLRGRAEALRSGRGDSDVTMLAAVFGVAALPAGEFPFVSTLFPRAKNTTDSTSACGSSCSSSSSSSSCGGGDGGGGGCGGCGGD